MKRVQTALVRIGLLASILLCSCNASPNALDLEAVKDDFLSLRFSAPFESDLKHLSEKELFRLACKQRRVRCGEVLTMLEKKYPDFYRTLNGQKVGKDAAGSKDVKQTGGKDAVRPAGGKEKQ